MWRTVIVLALAAVGLAGCFVSKGPLIDAKHAVFPYDRIVFAERGSSDQSTLFRQGSAYTVKGKNKSDGEAHIRLLKVADDLYVLQLDIVEENAPQYLYALLKVDLPGKSANLFKAIASDADKDLPPGLSRCDRKDQEQVCIDQLDAYVDYARKAIAAGAKPDTLYTIVSTR